MTPVFKLYRFLYMIVRCIFSVIYPMRTLGRENIPDGAVIVCANHSSWLDTLFLPLALGRDSHLHIIAKIELFRIPILSGMLKRMEMIGIDREVSDVSAIRAILGYLKRGEKVAIFPQGTRVLPDDAVAAKRGAVWLAERAGVRLLPVYIPEKKKLFRHNQVVIGKPYEIPKTGGRRATDEHIAMSDGLMEKIWELGTDCASRSDKRKATRRGRREIQENEE